jgi:hypothetical protein
MWMDLPVWVRLLIALGLFAGGAAILYYVSFRLGFGVIGLGFVALIFSTKNESEKKGYRF